jgi:hypothetical protein
MMAVHPLTSKLQIYTLLLLYSCAFMGIFALGVYPLALELIVECTYPVDQAIGTAFIFLSRFANK